MCAAVRLLNCNTGAVGAQGRGRRQADVPPPQKRCRHVDCTEPVCQGNTIRLEDHSLKIFLPHNKINQAVDAVVLPKSAHPDFCALLQAWIDPDMRERAELHKHALFVTLPCEGPRKRSWGTPMPEKIWEDGWGEGFADLYFGAIGQMLPGTTLFKPHAMRTLVHEELAGSVDVSTSLGFLQICAMMGHSPFVALKSYARVQTNRSSATGMVQAGVERWNQLKTERMLESHSGTFAQTLELVRGRLREAARACIQGGMAPVPRDVPFGNPQAMQIFVVEMIRVAREFAGLAQGGSRMDSQEGPASMAE